MTICINEGLLKITQKLCLIVLSIYLYTIFSSEIRTCPLIKIGSKIYPFDNQFLLSSVLFLTGAAISIVECDIWPYNTKPKNRIIQFLAEVHKLIFVDKLIVYLFLILDKCIQIYLLNFNIYFFYYKKNIKKY